MDTSNIPKLFWYTVSICILAVTFGVLHLAYKSSCVSIKFANIQIDLSAAAADLEEINRQLEEKNSMLAEGRAQLERREKILEELVNSAPTRTIEVAEIRKRIMPADTRIPMPKIEEIPNEKFKALDKRLNTVQEVVRRPWEQRQ
jgi:septal ring factor EnvC (AmiA/AmiB activator)